MKELLTMLLECLPPKPKNIRAAGDIGLWSDGEMILCSSEPTCRLIANLLRDILRDSTIVVKTGYFDPFEDGMNGETDDYTDFYYIDFE